MSWPEHVARMGDNRGVITGLVGNIRERDHLGNLIVDVKIILKWILIGMNRPRLDCSSSGYGHVAGTCECSCEISDTIKCGEFLDWLRTC